MLDNRYPFNLIRDIHRDAVTDDAHVEATHIGGLFEMLDKLSEREQEVLRMRYFEGLTYTACSDAIGLTPSRVRQIAEKALQRLRGSHRMNRYKAVTQAELNQLNSKYLRTKGENEQLREAYERLGMQGVNPLAVHMLTDIIRPEQLRESIGSLRLSTRSINALLCGGIHTIEDLLKTPERDLIALQNVGEKSLQEIKLKIREFILMPDYLREPDEAT